MRPVRVLVVEDSFVMRQLISDILQADPQIEIVGQAKDGLEALLKIPELKPNCVTLDLKMPGLQGAETLSRIMDECPTPVVILSAHSKEDADVTIRCLANGAVGFVLKPSGELSLDIDRVQAQLIQEVKMASRVPVARIQSLLAKRPTGKPHKITRARPLVVIGASTGGPQTLEFILASLPEDFPAPILVVQHVPSLFFTHSLAERLKSRLALEVRVPEDGEDLEAGTVYLAPAGFHMTVENRTTHPGHRPPQDTSRWAGAVIRLAEASPEVLGPSIDITMQSVAHLTGGECIGIILTGIGHDGLEGMRTIKKLGGRTIAQDETALIFGMPKAVIDATLADTVLPANRIAHALMEGIPVDQRM